MRLVIAFLFVVCSNGQSLGYDYASSCARPSRGGRAARAPCDLAARPYCNTPGEHYPWQAIRRFVRENQGLMRRMYGEERHIAVLKAEIENFVEDDDDDDGKPTDFAEDILKTQMMYTKKTHRGLREKPHFRPVQNSEKNKKTDPDRLKVKPLNTTNVNTNLNATQTKINETNTEKANKTEITNETANEDTGISYKTRLESIANIEINNLDPDVITLDAVIKQSIETNSIYPKYSTKEANADTEINTNTTETSSQNTMTLTTTTDLPIPSSTESITEEQYDDTTTEVSKDGWKPMTADSSTLPPTLLFSEHEKNKVDRIDMKTSNKKEEFHPKPLQHQESVRPAVIKLRGANACESKEEMAAPFWANSTRGEVLALLNMYPFEQYIHMESCVHERKQMYCREGCRCEQQYRLHRLLAYDPRNECRGIFADWFKFPGCCVCKCYDVPLEFRARSPRILHPQYDEEVKRIIYEDVARDWYSMSAYDNDIDDEDLF